MSPGTASERRTHAWSDTAIAELLDVVRCPVCAAGIVDAQRCPACGADFSGTVGSDLWLASRNAADALRARQALLEKVPLTPVPVSAARAADPAPQTPGHHATADGPGDVDVAHPGAGAARASATVQSVLAVAGAALVAVAAVVFTFFNPDLADPWPRAAIIATIAAAFLAGSALLARRRLRFSAEAIGTLGVVFVALTVTAALPLLPPDANGWVFTALATLVAGGALTALGPRAGIRVWLWIGMLSLAFVPLLLALGALSALATTAGCLAAAAAASALVTLAGRVVTGFGRPLRAERTALTVAQFGFAAAALVAVWGTDAATAVPTAYLVSATMVSIAAIAVASAHHPAGRLWSGVAGAAIVGATSVLPLEMPPLGIATWFAAFPVAAGVGLVAVGALTPLHRMVARGALFIGAVTVVAIIAAIPTLTAFLSLAGALLSPTADRMFVLPGGAVGLTAGLAALALSLASFAGLTRNREPIDAAEVAASTPEHGFGAHAVHSGRAAHAPDAPDAPRTPVVSGSAVAGRVGASPDGTTLTAEPDGERMPQPLGTRWLGFLGAWYAVLAFLTVLSLPGLEAWTRVVVGLVAAVTAGAIVATRMRGASAAVRMPLVAGAHAAVVFAAVLSWRDSALAVNLTLWAGAAVVASIGVLALTVPRAGRFVHVGAGFAYALVVLATALGRAGADALVVVCLTTCAAGIVAIAVTFARRVPSREWYAVLVVTAVPFAIGVLQVVFERSGWTALSTAVIFGLALTLVTTTRRGLGLVVRTLAAATLVPAIAVVVVCLGAQLLPMSGSPIVLPMIAAVVAGVLASADLIADSLERRLPHAQAAAAGRAVEASALLTAAIAVALALVRTSAGLPTTLLVLVILGTGFAATALVAPRRYAWPLAGAAFTGALWSAWGIAGVTGLEPYLLPPALGAAVVGVVLTARGRRAIGLYTVGLAVAVVPVLFALALSGTTLAGTVLSGRDAAILTASVDPGFPVRALAFIAAAWALGAASVVVTRASRPRIRRLRVLRTPTLAVAIVAATAAAVQGLRWGAGLDPAPTDPVIVAALAFGLVGGGAAASAARSLHRLARTGSRLAGTRWLGGPAVAILGVATWPAIERDWFVIWTMWALLLGLLTLMLAVAARGLRGPTGLPPVWFLFAVSFVTAVVAWSPRDLRVEWFSLPLGLFLLAAGALAVRRPAADPPFRDLGAWPAGWTGSWPLLGPGLVTMLSASVAATYTDPRTWRAILVMAIALVAILVGATQRLAAPFVIGIVVLPIENVLAFMVQIGRGIEAMPWWITLSVVGAVLLIIAVGYERRAGDGTGLSARLRDLV
ncbi:SCO7613 C-terminal domain-containing membrane protein [Microbacterium sp. ZW T2_14]|uniref:SCO7613 C-terminal domain-containing membrane protein n=1 Tax=Microbacterium sp. ZW T2_14 TaxID=3378079 RepID=UPI0038540280